MSSIIRVELITVLLGFLTAPEAEALRVIITHPAVGQPAFGESVIVAEVESEVEIESVELLVDRRSRGRLAEPPWRWLVDLGTKSAEHLLEVVAIDVEGQRAETRIVTREVQIDEQIDVELQQLYVTVTRSGGAAIDLDRSHFAITDEGEGQDIVTFEKGDVPLTAAVLVDTSESMAGTELETALTSTRAFIDGMQPLDRASLILFSDHIIRATPMTGFREVLVAALSGVQGRGGTALNDHLFVGMKSLEKRQGRRVVLLLSDGADSASVLDMADVKGAAERSQAILYWLRLPIPGTKLSSAWRNAEEYQRERATLEEIVRQSGGEIVELSGVEGAAGAFAEVLAELRGQYVLGYYPSNRRDDGAWHPVKVRVEGQGLKVRTRGGYVDH